MAEPDGDTAGGHIVHRTLIVAKLNTDDTNEITDAFARSDETDLPRMIGVSRRTLFHFHGLYFHLIEAEDDIQPKVYELRDHPLYVELSNRLAEILTPYDPGWKEPKDAMALPFYKWTPEGGAVR